MAVVLLVVLVSESLSHTAVVVVVVLVMVGVAVFVELGPEDEAPEAVAPASSSVVLGSLVHAVALDEDVSQSGVVVGASMAMVGNPALMVFGPAEVFGAAELINDVALSLPKSVLMKEKSRNSSWLIALTMSCSTGVSTGSSDVKSLSKLFASIRER